MSPNSRSDNLNNENNHDTKNKICTAVQDPVHKLELLYDGVYYDVTSWIHRHPGGGIIKLYTSTGEDATHAVQQFHYRSSFKVMAIMKSLPHRPADLKKLSSVKSSSEKRNDALTSDFLTLFKELQNEGFFEPSYFHVLWRFLDAFFFGLTAIYILTSQPLTLTWQIIGICFMALSIGRTGWIQHEAGHHSLTGYPKVDRKLQSIFFGLVFGLSGGYWVNQHSRHHAKPQHLKHDVDLQTLPLLAFHKAIMDKAVSNGNVNVFLRYQKWLFLPFDCLLVALVWKFYLHPRFCVIKKEWFDLGCMIGSYFIGYYVGIGYSVLFTWLATMYLFGNFSLSHSHLPVTNEPTHWVEYSLIHTMNVRSSWWVDYWMGYLNYQIEHHLFPTMPQFKNKMCRDRVKALAKKHGLPYNVCSYWEAVQKTFNNLDNVSAGI